MFKGIVEVIKNQTSTINQVLGIRMMLLSGCCKSTRLRHLITPTQPTNKQAIKQTHTHTHTHTHTRKQKVCQSLDISKLNWRSLLSKMRLFTIQALLQTHFLLHSSGAFRLHGNESKQVKSPLIWGSLVTCNAARKEGRGFSQEWRKKASQPIASYIQVVGGESEPHSLSSAL